MSRVGGKEDRVHRVWRLPLVGLVFLLAACRIRLRPLLMTSSTFILGQLADSVTRTAMALVVVYKALGGG